MATLEYIAHTDTHMDPECSGTLCYRTVILSTPTNHLTHTLLCTLPPPSAPPPPSPCPPCRRKLSEVNKKLGSKFEISETELLSTVDACKALMAEGQDIDTGAASTQVCVGCVLCVCGGAVSERRGRISTQGQPRHRCVSCFVFVCVWGGEGSEGV